MNRITLIFLFGFFSIFTAFSQQTLIKGSVKESISLEPIVDVLVTIEETNQTTQTSLLGEFIFNNNVKKLRS